MSNSIYSEESNEKGEKQETQLISTSSDNSIYIDIALCAEENISKIISKDVSKNCEHIRNKKIIFELLNKLENFKQFIMLYNIDNNLIYEILSNGVLKTYKKNDNIFVKNTYPEYFYLVLEGSVAVQNMGQEYCQGKFFGELFLIINKKYKNTCYANSDNTILLLLTKEFFMLNIKNKITKGNEKIRLAIIRSFEIFRSVEAKKFETYFQKMIKLFPRIGEVIISSKDIANAIYLIYEGSCIINDDKYGDLIILEKGDIFGDECLTNFDNEGKIMKKKYLYNIINKSQNSIIFKFLLKDLTKYIINGIKTHLNSYFIRREEIITNHFAKKKELKIKFTKEYDLFNKPTDKYEILNNKYHNNNIITRKGVKKTFNNVLSEIRLDKKRQKYKKKIKPNISKIMKKNPQFINNLFNSLKRKKASNSKSSIEKKNSNIPTLKMNKSTKSVIRKKILWPLEGKSPINNNYLSSNTNSDYNHSLKLFITDNNTNHTNNTNNNNSNIYITSLNNQNNSGAMSIKEKLIYSQNRPSSNVDRIITDSTNLQNLLLQKFSNSAFSSNRGSTSYKSKSKSNNFDVIKQVNINGCPIIDTMAYFNQGNNELFMKRCNSANYKSAINKKRYFYRTQKYNIPLYVLNDTNEKKKFPYLINYFNNL